MAANSHALLSASSAKRWMACPPSARLSEAFEDETSEFAAEGTDAHALCEWKLRKALGEDAGAKPELAYHSEEMEECSDSYVEYILETIKEVKKTCPDPIVLVEQKLDYSKYVKEGFGTGDCLIIADKRIYIVDFKYGKGISVNAEKNPQMELYSLGGIELFDCLYDIDTVVMTIYQPRLGNVSVSEITKAELLEWANETLAPLAELAWEGKGEFKCGDHCRFCKAKVKCRERANSNMALASMGYAEPPTLKDEEVEEVLAKVDDLLAWASDVKDYALDAALKGKKWMNWKIVEGRSIRKYVDENAVVATVSEAGLDPFEKKLLSITELQKRIGKAKFAELVEKYVIKPQGKPTLVPRSDKREEMSSAKADFEDIQEEN